MPTAVTSLPDQVLDHRKRWTRAEYEELPASGLLGSQRLELVEGELISRMGKKQPHVLSVALLRAWLTNAFGPRTILQEAPIDVAPEDNPTNAPEPDLIVPRRDLSSFRDRKPRPDDLHLVVEAADSTLGFDLTTKAALYARAGILEYWALDISGRRLIVHREPQAGRYGAVAAYSEEETVAPLAAPDSPLRVGDVFLD